MSTTPSPLQVSAQAVEQLIRQDIRSAESLSELLYQEQQALKSRSHNQLTAILSEKQALLARLESSAGQRSNWINFLVKHSQLTAEQCWQRLLNELNSELLPQLWQEFEEKISTCKQSNEINGKAISRGQRTLKQLLGILRGQHMETAKLYNATGETHSGRISRTVVKA